MSIGFQENRVLTVTPGRGLRELSIPCDASGNTGAAGIHYNRVLGVTEILAGLPLAVANGTGAVYLSTIHGGLGSDARNLLGLPAAGFNPNVPAFAGPPVTAYGLAPPANSGFSQTEKVQISPFDAGINGGGTIWQGVQGRNKLNFSLWISPNTPAYVALELYRDLNPGDKVAGQFGAGTGAADPRNAQLVASWTNYGAFRDQNKPNFATSIPFDLPAGCNLYLLFRNLADQGANLAVGSIWLS